MTVLREIPFLASAVRRAFANNATDEAASIAFWAFFALFPLTLVVLSVIGHVMGTEEAQASLSGVLKELFPGSEQLVLRQLTEVVQSRKALGLVGGIGLIWGASKGLGAVTRSINRAADLKCPYPFGLGGIRHILFTVVCLLPLLGVLVLSALVELPRLGIFNDEVATAAPRILCFVLVVTTVALIFRLAPYERVTWQDVLPGALLTAILLEIGRHAFIVFLAHGVDFEAMYGSMASIAIALLWLYASAWVLILGAEYNIARLRASESKTAKGKKK
jgi:membrane protein